VSPVYHEGWGLFYWNLPSHFVKNIEQVEFQLESESGPPSLWNHNGEQFQIVFQRALPSAKRIFLNYYDPLNYRPNGNPEDVTTFARAFTPHYTVFISVNSHPTLVSLPQPKDLYWLDRASQWTLAQKGWMRDSVVPPKEIITGIEGIFLKTGRKKKYLSESRRLYSIFATNYTRSSISTAQRKFLLFVPTNLRYGFQERRRVERPLK
jgi:hypothetical protein